MYQTVSRPIIDGDIVLRVTSSPTPFGLTSVLKKRRQKEFATTSSESGDSQLSGDTTLLLDEVRSVLEDSLSKTTMTAFQQLWNLDCKPSPPTKLVAKTAHSVTFSLADLESGTDSDSEFESVMLSSHRQFTMENKPIWMDTKMTEVLFWDTVKECKKALDVVLGENAPRKWKEELVRATKSEITRREVEEEIAAAGRTEYSDHEYYYSELGTKQLEQCYQWQMSWPRDEKLPQNRRYAQNHGTGSLRGSTVTHATHVVRKIGMAVHSQKEPDRLRVSNEQPTPAKTQTVASPASNFFAIFDSDYRASAISTSPCPTQRPATSDPFTRSLRPLSRNGSADAANTGKARRRPSYHRGLDWAQTISV